MKAAILTAINVPLEVREIEWLPPSYGQVLAKVLVSGICGAQLQEWRGEKGDQFPRLLGHEACVEVLETGPGVMTVRSGDKCVAHWRKGDGVESDNPKWSYVADKTWQFQKLTAGRITTFSTHSVVSENRLTAVPKDTPDELCALLGCGLSTALGTMENEANLRFGESVLIIGCGGLGLNLILAAKLRQASYIAVVDINESKINVAHEMGAHAVHIKSSTWTHDSFDVVIDTTGNPDAINDGLKALSPSGRFIMVGQPKPRENVMLTNARHMFDGDGKTIIATQGGRFNPSKDVARYVAMHRAGLLNLTGLVTHRFPLEVINEGIELVRQGQAGRVMIDCQ